MSDMVPDEEWEAMYPDAPSGVSKCHDTKCLLDPLKENPAARIIAHGALRLGKAYHSPFHEGRYEFLRCHPACMFNQLSRSRAGNRRIEEIGDIRGFYDLKEEDQALVLGLIEAGYDGYKNAKKPRAKKTKAASAAAAAPAKKKAKKTAPKKEPAKSKKIEDDADDG